MTQFTHPKPIDYFPGKICSAKLRQARDRYVFLHDCNLPEGHNEHMHLCGRHSGSLTSGSRTCEWMVET